MLPLHKSVHFASSSVWYFFVKLVFMSAVKLILPIDRIIYERINSLNSLDRLTHVLCRLNRSIRQICSIEQIVSRIY